MAVALGNVSYWMGLTAFLNMPLAVLSHSAALSHRLPETVRATQSKSHRWMCYSEHEV
ncbi:hypothetical protein K456DRAFT_50298, partial [Colletotrichum gloeosporioides 23]